MVTKHISSAELCALETCKACLHFVEVRGSAGLCTAHGKGVKAVDFRCSTRFKRSTKKVPSASA